MFSNYQYIFLDSKKHFICLCNPFFDSAKDLSINILYGSIDKNNNRSCKHVLTLHVILLLIVIITTKNIVVSNIQTSLTESTGKQGEESFVLEMSGRRIPTT